ncbi:glycosyltransferase family 2 protein [Microvirga sp. 2MCAF38]|uniref:glycosyltransferase family 2 protein n=1 Tax=Microvirga sp. 2MCAF38 TaxID=3232989 RepID=UPI003F9E635B
MRFTIVTPTLNRCALLQQALDSVRVQGHVDVEHIVVDGGSTDGTLEMLTGRPEITVLRDRGLGLYDAINLGIDHASGDVLGLLNSDDLYAAGAFAAVERGLAAAPNADAVCGGAELFDETGILARYDDPRDLALDPHSALIGACIPNARFFRREIFDRVGLFSLDYPHIADRHFLARTLIAGIRTVPLDALVYCYRQHGGSLTFAEGVTEGEVLRTELLKLAREIAVRPDAPESLKYKARTLQGRCLMTLARARLLAGHPVEALNLLTRIGERPSTAPLATIVAAMVDKFRGR